MASKCVCCLLLFLSVSLISLLQRDKHDLGINDHHPVTLYSFRYFFSYFTSLLFFGYGFCFVFCLQICFCLQPILCTVTQGRQPGLTQRLTTCLTRQTSQKTPSKLTEQNKQLLMKTTKKKILQCLVKSFIPFEQWAVCIYDQCP